MDFPWFENAIVIAPKSLQKEECFLRLTYSELVRYFSADLAKSLLSDDSMEGKAKRFAAYLVDPSKTYQSPRLVEIQRELLGKKPNRKVEFKGHPVIFDGYPEVYGVYFAYLLQELPNLSSSWACPFHSSCPEFDEEEDCFYSSFSKEEIEELGYPSLQKYLLRKKEAESFPFVLNGSSMEA